MYTNGETFVYRPRPTADREQAGNRWKKHCKNAEKRTACIVQDRSRKDRFSGLEGAGLRLQGGKRNAFLQGLTKDGMRETAPRTSPGTKCSGGGWGRAGRKNELRSDGATERRAGGGGKQNAGRHTSKRDCAGRLA